MGFVKDDRQVLLEQRREPERRLSQQPRRDHRVAQPMDDEPEVTRQEPDVVIGAVQELPDASVRKGRLERRKIDRGERVDQGVTVAGRQLHQAHLFPEVMEGIGLRVDGQRAAADVPDPYGKGFGRVDPGRVHERRTVSSAPEGVKRQSPRLVGQPPRHDSVERAILFRHPGPGKGGA